MEFFKRVRPTPARKSAVSREWRVAEVYSAQRSETGFLADRIEFRGRGRNERRRIDRDWMSRPHGLRLVAIVYTELGDTDQAFFWLEKAYKGREHDLAFSNVWPLFDSPRPDPRFKDLMRRIGLPQAT
ncbi:MAG: hypothetical protein DMG34_20010 [Acidobacteria bacterium]|nr:MAG: hypothetical protein DMG34_20010 [Acidobacteriota bacterium]